MQQNFVASSAIKGLVTVLSIIKYEGGLKNRICRHIKEAPF
jgi:hypothetical protein